MASEGQINRRLGKTIARKRRDAEYTQEEVSEHLGIGKEQYSRIERGVAGVSIDKLYALADLFRCSVDSFLVESSRRSVEQAERVGQLLEGLAAADRQLIVEFVAKLARRLKSKKAGSDDDE